MTEPFDPYTIASHIQTPSLRTAFSLEFLQQLFASFRPMNRQKSRQTRAGQGMAVVCACLALVGLSRCGGGVETGWDRIVRTGVLRIGTVAAHPPFASMDTASGAVLGFDIDLINEVCRELGCAPEYIVVAFDGIVAGLRAGQYDMIASALSITPERARNVAFSDSYYDGGLAIAVPSYDTIVNGEDDLTGLRIGVQSETTGESRAREIPRANVLTFDNIAAAFIQMENGQLDAVISDLTTASLIVRRRRQAKIVGPLLNSEQYGFAVRSADSKLLSGINRALAAIVSDGRYTILHDRWFGAGG